MVAEALQQSVFATDSVEGPQFTDGFTPGAQTLSLFGLDPGFVKYLIDGRPMSDYPALYTRHDQRLRYTGRRYRGSLDRRQRHAAFPVDTGAGIHIHSG
jgi:hypothetical protein